MLLSSITLVTNGLGIAEGGIFNTKIQSKKRMSKHNTFFYKTSILERYASIALLTLRYTNEWYMWRLQNLAGTSDEVSFVYIALGTSKYS